MTDEELDQLGKQMWRLHRDEKDPMLKTMFGLIHEQTVNLRKGTGGPELREMMMRTLRDLAKLLEERSH